MCEIDETEWQLVLEHRRKVLALTELILYVHNHQY